MTTSTCATFAFWQESWRFSPSLISEENMPGREWQSRHEGYLCLEKDMSEEVFILQFLY